MKWLSLIGAILFAVFAVVQYNDPDSMAWIILYLVVAITCGFAWFGKGNSDLTLGLTVLCAALSLIHIPGLFEFLGNDDGMRFADGMSNEHPYIEQSREFGGLLIAAVFLFFVYKGQVKR